MSIFDPQGLYSRQEKSTVSGQVIRKRGTKKIISCFDFKQASDFLIKNGYQVFPPGIPLPINSRYHSFLSTYTYWTNLYLTSTQPHIHVSLSQVVNNISDFRYQCASLRGMSLSELSLQIRFTYMYVSGRMMFPTGSIIDGHFTLYTLSDIDGEDFYQIQTSDILNSEPNIPFILNFFSNGDSANLISSLGNIESTKYYVEPVHMRPPFGSLSIVQFSNQDVQAFIDNEGAVPIDLDRDVFIVEQNFNRDGGGQARFVCSAVCYLEYSEDDQ